MLVKGLLGAVLRPSLLISLAMFVAEWIIVTYLGDSNLIDGIALYNVPVAVGLFFFGKWMKEIGISKRLVQLIFILTVVLVAFTERDMTIIVFTSVLLIFMALGYFVTK
ncbi:MAG: hypothetical protein ACUVQ8_02370 [Nitrososphaeria archaeon]